MGGGGIVKRRVVVTGMGVLSSLGVGTEDFWSGLAEGFSGAKHLSKLESCDLYSSFDFASQVVGEVSGFDPARLPQEVRRLDRYIQFAIDGALQAIGEAKLRDMAGVDRRRV